MLELRNLTKKYGDNTVLNNINFTFDNGVYGLLGANGAGKSTLMNLITDNVKRTGGEILYNGEDILKLGAKFRKKVGYTPQLQGMYEDFTARNRTIILATHVVSDIESIADSVIMLCKGKPAAVGTPAQLISGVKDKVFELCGDHEEISRRKAEFGKGQVYQTESGYVLRITAESCPEGFSSARGVNLEDVYLYYAEGKMSEFRRVLLSRKTILFMLTAALLGAVFFLYDCASEKEITLSGEELSAYIESYPKLLRSIRENAENFSSIAVLSGGFSAENIRKTAADYSKLTEIKPIVGNNKGFVLLSGYVTGDILILTVTLLISANFCEERRKGLNLLVRSTKNGRRRLSVQRVGIIISAAIMSSLTVYFFCYWLAVLSCGDMGIFRPIQSVPEFSLCPYPITISDYLVLSVLLKALGAAVSGLLLYFLSALFEPMITFGMFGGAADLVGFSVIG